MREHWLITALGWLLQYVNVTCFLAANLYVISGHCRWFSPFVTAMG